MPLGDSFFQNVVPIITHFVNVLHPALIKCPIYNSIFNLLNKVKHHTVV